MTAIAVAALLVVGVPLSVFAFFFSSQASSEAAAEARVVRARADAITEGWCWERQQLLGRRAAKWMRVESVALRVLAVSCLGQAVTLVVLAGTLTQECLTVGECL